MFFCKGLISPRAFSELIRITKPGGIITWNIAMGYESYCDYENYDDIGNTELHGSSITTIF